MIPRLLTADIRKGIYARKQLESADGLVAWSHRRRFAVALSLADRAAGRRVLDYGCGDGSFLAMMHAVGIRPAETVGAEIAPDLVADCRKRLKDREINFVSVGDLDVRPSAAFDLIYCMEVLEHVVDTEAVLRLLERLLAPQGQIIISVPVETGLPLVVKEVTRRIAGWRGIGDYPGTEAYQLSEWIPSLLADSRQHIVRKRLRNPDGSTFHDHKGFNWMALRERVRQRFLVKDVLSSPFTWLPPHFGTQAWFVCEKVQSRDVPCG